MISARVFIVSERPLIVSGVQAWVEGELELVGVAPANGLALSLIVMAQPDVVVLDLGSTPLPKLELVRALYGQQQRLVAIGSCLDVDAVARALNAGVAVYLLE